VTYHQHLNVVDFGGGEQSAQQAYARATRMPAVILTRYPGSQATWTHAAFPGTTVLTIELPASVSASSVTRHVQAVRFLATHHRSAPATLTRSRARAAGPA